MLAKSKCMGKLAFQSENYNEKLGPPFHFKGRKQKIHTQFFNA
jgi:hypothetical protein